MFQLSYDTGRLRRGARTCILWIAVWYVHVAHAQSKLGPPLSGVTNVSVFVSWLIGIIITILWPAIIVFWLFVGFKFVSAQGSSEKIIEARNALLWAVVGTAIVAGAQILKVVIEGTINSLGSP